MENLQDFANHLLVVVYRDVSLKADVGKVRLRCYVDCHVTALATSINSNLICLKWNVFVINYNLRHNIFITCIISIII